MKMNPRELPMGKAQNELAGAVVNAIEKYDLTYGEITQILSTIMGTWAKYQIRDERSSKAS